MRWTAKVGDILNEPADVLICSANPFLTLSGGVGGALMLRYGDQLCHELEDYLKASGQRFAERGTVVLTRPPGTPYKAILHAVAVDGMYESSAKVVTRVLRDAMNAAARVGARSVAVTALATGYGRLSSEEFAMGVVGLAGFGLPRIQRAVIVVRSEHDADKIRQIIDPQRY